MVGLLLEKKPKAVLSVTFILQSDAIPWILRRLYRRGAVIVVFVVGLFF